ncbi:hypothetical protein RZV17_19130 [Xanthomonas cannabis]|uniref:hypothetical protein n=1 Tax=Xanthomonas cannabis TaxID=1885674 RepID=UPI0033BD93CF
MHTATRLPPDTLQHAIDANRSGQFDNNWTWAKPANVGLDASHQLRIIDLDGMATTRS